MPGISSAPRSPPTEVQLADAKLGRMKNEIFAKLYGDATTTPAEKQQILASIKDKYASFKIVLDLTKWHQARVGVVGDEMLVSIDGKPAGYLKSEGLNHPTKNMVGFTVRGKSIQLDNLRVWEATASPEWSSHRAEVLAAIGKE